MTRLLTIIALLFATPAWAEGSSKFFDLGEFRFSEERIIGKARKCISVSKLMGPNLWGSLGCIGRVKLTFNGRTDWYPAPFDLKTLRADMGKMSVLVFQLKNTGREYEARAARISGQIRSTKNQINRAASSRNKKPKLQIKDNLVLLPIKLPADLASQSEIFENLIVEGLTQRFNVYSGSAVKEKLEVEFSKSDCSASSCIKNLAIEFNGELVGDAAINSVGSSYIISLQINNIISGQIIHSVNNICTNCNLDSLLVAILEGFSNL